MALGRKKDKKEEPKDIKKEVQEMSETTNESTQSTPAETPVATSADDKQSTEAQNQRAAGQQITLKRRTGFGQLHELLPRQRNAGRADHRFRPQPRRFGHEQPADHDQPESDPQLLHREATDGCPANVAATSRSRLRHLGNGRPQTLHPRSHAAIPASHATAGSRQPTCIAIRIWDVHRS